MGTPLGLRLGVQKIDRYRIKRSITSFRIVFGSSHVRWMTDFLGMAMTFPKSKVAPRLASRVPRNRSDALRNAGICS